MWKLKLICWRMHRRFRKTSDRKFFMKVNSNKALNKKLSEKIESLSLNRLFGTWEDSRDSDEIISEIIESRVEKNDLEAF